MADDQEEDGVDEQDGDGDAHRAVFIEHGDQHREDDGADSKKGEGAGAGPVAILGIPFQQEQKEKVILATVKGDIHDIGKNIVRVLLENYGYQVIDLGKDVDPEVIADAALQDDIRVIGLSALMTTTVTSMEDTIRLLRQKKKDAKIVVGGAVLNEEYAGRIGADQYAKDAMATVRFADQVFAAVRGADKN